ncbi:VWA domain-containing protein [uncultured Amnibacterium sp.]|uniref:VWA domain-containing protein n=1 Tax=uncultured Amnibacterium sp. TaxID=1631851 RepID=UPI0035CBC497
MTDSNHSALLLIVDRSGSMESIRDEMVGSLTTLLRDQAQQPGLLTVDVVTFDDRIETTQVQADPSTIEIELAPRGMTALLDAIGIGVSEFGGRLAALPEHARPGTVLVVVATDGHENAIREWQPSAIKGLLDQQREQYGWDFVFLGANQDAITTGASLGFAADSALDFDADAQAVAPAMASLSAYVSANRSGRRGSFTQEDRRNASRRHS